MSKWYIQVKCDDFTKMIEKDTKCTLILVYNDVTYTFPSTIKDLDNTADSAINYLFSLGIKDSSIIEAYKSFSIEFKNIKIGPVLLANIETKEEK